jgi:hypothetical protein
MTDDSFYGVLLQQAVLGLEVVDAGGVHEDCREGGEDVGGGPVWGQDVGEQAGDYAD